MPEGHIIHHLAGRLNAEFRPGALSITSPQRRFAAEAAALDGSALTRAEAFGKHLFLHFEVAAAEHIIYIHLGLIGKLTFESAAATWGQIRLKLVRGNEAATLRGPQWCRLISEAEYAAAVAKIGDDPIRQAAPPVALRTRVLRSQRQIGSLLMDQKLFAGVGNIYRAEVLFRQGISPFRAGNELSAAEFAAIWEDLVMLMRAGVISARIDTVRPEHMPDTMGREPRKDDHGGEVYVYRRAGQPCYICGTAISQREMEGRNLFWCGTCQPV